MTDNSTEEGVANVGGTSTEQTPAGDFLAGLVLFLVALYALVESIRMPFFGDSGVWGSPGLTPGIVSAVLMLLSGLLMFRSRRLSLAAFGFRFEVERARGLAVFGLIIAYVAAIPWIGYAVATFVMVFVFQVAFAAKRTLRFVLVWGVGLSAVLTVALYYLFAEFFFIPLPKGVFGV